LRVTTVRPGNVATRLLSMSKDGGLVAYGGPGGTRLLDPEEVAASVVHTLAQPEHVAVNEILVEPRDEPA
jgi:NADP-dependent 3-hydroxy acid dehydrogenase YdfG